MIRKRTSIKPNLGQATPKPPEPPTAAAAPQPTVTAATGHSKKKEETDDLDKRINDAIGQLTGQRLEPIKSASLKNSANRDVQLKDLLFVNPPLTKDQRRHRRTDLAKKRTIQSNQGQSPPKQNLEEQSLVPKVRLGPEGKLVLDESSTVINRKSCVKEQDAIIEDNDEIISRTNYDSYRRRPLPSSHSKWSSEDTQKFYHALTLLGTDFSMMESLLFSGHRSRAELHRKFKREERVNKTKIDIALSSTISVSSEELDGLKDVL